MNEQQDEPVWGWMQPFADWLYDRLNEPWVIFLAVLLFALIGLAGSYGLAYGLATSTIINN